MTGRRAAALAAIAAAVGAAAAWSTQSLAGASDTAATGSEAQDAPATERAEVVRGDLSSEHELSGNVSYGDSWVVPLEPGGIVTASEPEGSVVAFGNELLRIDGEPVVLAEGEVPMYRELSSTSPRQTGADVEQLQRFLLALGFDDGGRLEADGEYGASTRRAVEDWQEAVGLPGTGAVDRSQLVFSPAPLRIASANRVGTAFDQLVVTEPAPVVAVETSNRDRIALPVGNAVSVELADGTVVAGTVSEQERAVQDDGSTVWRSTIDVGDELVGDESTVLVSSTVVVANDVLFVPVGALLALAEGGFAVELSEPAGTRLVAVEVGEVVAGLAEIAGEVAAGDEVVVPA